MLLNLKPRAKTGLSQFVEEVVHLYLNVERAPLWKYIAEREACILLGLNESQLFVFLKYSKEVHGVIFVNGQLFVHPDGLREMMASRMKSALRRSCKEWEQYRDQNTH